MSSLGSYYGFNAIFRPETAQKFLDKSVEKLSTTPGLSALSFKGIIFLISFLYFLICIVKIICFFRGGSEKKNYEIKTDDGTVSVSPAIVNNYVKEILKNDKEIKNLKVETIKHGKKFDIKMKADIATDISVADKSANIQNDIKNEVSEKIGIEIGQVELVVAKLLKKPKEEAVPPVQTSNNDYHPVSANTTPEKESTLVEPTPVTENKVTDEAPKEEIKEEIEVADHPTETPITEEKPEKKSFFGSLFGKKEKKVEEDMDDTPKEEEYEEIKEEPYGSYDDNNDSSEEETKKENSDYNTTGTV